MNVEINGYSERFATSVVMDILLFIIIGVITFNKNITAILIFVAEDTVNRWTNEPMKEGRMSGQ